MIVTDTTWTIAYRAMKPEPEPVLHRVDLEVPWSTAAYHTVFEFGEVLGPDYEVWYVSTRSDELAGRVAIEDVMNMLVDDEHRVPIADDGEPLEILRARQPYEATHED